MNEINTFNINVLGEAIISQPIIGETGVISASIYSDISNYKTCFWIDIRCILEEEPVMAPSYPGVRIAMHLRIHMKIYSFNDPDHSRTTWQTSSVSLFTERLYLLSRS